MSISKALAALTLVGAVGLATELLLLEHFDTPWQWPPLVLLAAMVIAVAGALRRPGAGACRALRLVAGLCVAAGALGVWLHYDGNVEFERERDPAARGLALVRDAVTGATPLLAPGALAQLGVLGLILARTLPASRPASATARRADDARARGVPPSHPKDLA